GQGVLRKRNTGCSGARPQNLRTHVQNGPVSLIFDALDESHIGKGISIHGVVAKVAVIAGSTASLRWESQLLGSGHVAVHAEGSNADDLQCADPVGAPWSSAASGNESRSAGISWVGRRFVGYGRSAE